MFEKTVDKKNIEITKLSKKMDSDIKSLNELLERKYEIISQNDSTIEQYV